MSDVFPEFLVPQKSMWRSSVMPTEALEEEAKKMKFKSLLDSIDNKVCQKVA